jgi:choline kinase
MRAVVLAAGLGIRLRPMTETIPKCLLDVGGCSVLAVQLRMLGQIGVTDVVVVTGHASWRLEELAISRFRCVHNPDFAVSNQSASLWAAREELNGDTIMLFGDVLFSPRVLEDLLRAIGPHRLAVSRHGRYNDQADKVIDTEGRIRRLGKRRVACEEATGEFIGVAFLAATASDGFRAALETTIRADRQAFLYDVYQRCVDMGIAVQAVDVATPWIEIDTPEDLTRAREQVMPALGHRQTPRAPTEERG